MKDFNSHAHVERDGCAVVENGGLDNFNSHAHVERDLQVFANFNIILYFNSHAHVERDLQVFANFNIILYFNSHAHVERDLLPLPLCLSFQISTHTLTWSVTSMFSRVSLFVIFQLTRSRGA